MSIEGVRGCEVDVLILVFESVVVLVLVISCFNGVVLVYEFVFKYCENNEFVFVFGLFIIVVVVMIYEY